MSSDHFETTFLLGIDRTTAWDRLREHPLDSPSGQERYWLPGFDGPATVSERTPGARLRLTKDEEPCAGTDIVVTLEDAGSGTRITVVQSRFGAWLPAGYEMMAVGWRHLVADLQTYLWTGIHARRHLRPWGDLGADVTPTGGGLQLTDLRANTLADRLGLHDEDLLVGLAGAPVSSCDDLVTVLRVLGDRPGEIEAEWVRDGALQRSVATVS